MASTAGAAGNQTPELCQFTNEDYTVGWICALYTGGVKPYDAGGTHICGRGTRVPPAETQLYGEHLQGRPFQDYPHHNL